MLPTTRFIVRRIRFISSRFIRTTQTYNDSEESNNSTNEIISNFLSPLESSKSLDSLLLIIIISLIGYLTVEEVANILNRTKQRPLDENSPKDQNLKDYKIFNSIIREVDKLINTILLGTLNKDNVSY